MSDPLRQELLDAFERLTFDDYVGLVEKYELPEDFMLYLPEGHIGRQGSRLVIATGYLEDGSIEDLLQFEPRQPDRWWLKRGFPIWLGEWNPRLDDLRVAANPLQWLQWRCAGLVPLTKEARHQLRFVGDDVRCAA